MGTNLDIELKVRISEAMSRQIDAVVARRIDGTNRSDIVREAITLHLGNQLTAQLNQQGQADLQKAAAKVKRRLR
jgi:Arc/MetJ-type ribon-helix-helix transcriptional regulator